MRKIIKASGYRDYIEDDKDLEQREADDRNMLRILKKKMEVLRDRLEDCRTGFL